MILNAAKSKQYNFSDFLMPLDGASVQLLHMDWMTKIK